MFGSGKRISKAPRPVVYHRRVDTRTTTREATVEIRAMTVADVPGVMEIERQAFTSGWPPTAFRRELEHNALARYMVLLEDGMLAGFTGLWLMVDEAHVVTVAVSPERQQRGYGRLLVHALLEVARREGMAAATLECRVSNAVARHLYGEFGFWEVSVRKRYYSDNKEDAVIMTTEEFQSEAFQRRIDGLLKALETKVPGAEAALAAM
jgi:ribosomal-protein-alanine N-acetyltransferase